MTSIVRDAVDSLKPELEASRGELRIEEPLGCVMGHRWSLGQAIGNLVANAIKFVRPGQPPVVSLRSDLQRGRRRLWVQDNGIGIGQADRERIFRPFERLHGQKDYSGHGIGLAIVQRAAERVGGTVGLESELGKGSRFWIELESG